MGEGSMCDAMPVGISRNSVEQGTLRTFPNPATDELMVNLAKASGTGSIEIFDVRGMRVMDFAINSSMESIDISTLGSGSYLVRWIGDRKVMTGRFTKESDRKRK